MAELLGEGKGQCIKIPLSEKLEKLFEEGMPQVLEGWIYKNGTIYLKALPYGEQVHEDILKTIFEDLNIKKLSIDEIMTKGGFMYLAEDLIMLPKEVNYCHLLAILNGIEYDENYFYYMEPEGFNESNEENFRRYQKIKGYIKDIIENIPSISENQKMVLRLLEEYVDEKVSKMNIQKNIKEDKSRE